MAGVFEVGLWINEEAVLFASVSLRFACLLSTRNPFSKVRNGFQRHPLRQSRYRLQVGDFAPYAFE
ncbi:MAG: hypothetical protein AMJ46_04330 [Latescibacteria bacterium DG_63]|nr:MAG: hypothetical protein AMJ46_04330 [Latescibacteria bacterium DG_63]